LQNINLNYWGHNCFSIIQNDSILLIDPWFSNSGAFFGSWYQYPKNHHLKSKVLRIISEFQKSYIFISHEHEDHFDEEFLELLPPSSEILIPKYRDKTFREICKKFSANVIEINDDQNYNLGNEFYIRLLILDIGVNHDSAIIVKTKDFSFLNQNDCKAFDRLENIPEKIDYYSVQFSGATWHPSNFAFSERRKKTIAAEKVQKKLNNVLRAIRILNPEYFLPAAGPAIFPYLEENLSFGKDNIFIHHDHLHKFLNENNFKNTLYLRPGDLLNSDKTNPIMAPSSIRDIDEYKKGTINYWESIKYNFNRLELEKEILGRLKGILDFKFNQTPIIIFNLGNQFDDTDFSNEKKIFIDLTTKKILPTFNYESDYQEIVADERYFFLMCKKRWQNLYLSLRATVFRRPDKFNNEVNIFLFSDISNIKDNFLFTKNISKERVLIENSSGEIYEIDRFCPHQGADLCKANITDENILICPRHGWEFDLSNKGINQKSGKSLNVFKK
jgi:UDP-MurNAc hydroxylase